MAWLATAETPSGTLQIALEFQELSRISWEVWHTKWTQGLDLKTKKALRNTTGNIEKGIRFPCVRFPLGVQGCLGPFERRCLRCRGKEYDKRCPKPKKVLDLGVQD